MSNNSSTQVTRLTAQQKIAALREYLVDKSPVSEVCAKYDCAPSVFYKWRDDLFANGASVLETKKNPVVENRQILAANEKVQRLQATLALREQAISELVTDVVRLKKIQNGEI